MIRLRGHYNGQHIVLDESPPAELTLNTPVEIIVTKSREELLREMEASMKAHWEKPLPPDFVPQGRQWNREDCYDRGKRSSS